LFYAQSLLAQLDLPVMLFSSVALLLFLQDRVRACAIVCVPMVLMKETGAIVPLVFIVWLAAGRRWRDLFWFLPSLIVLAVWAAFLALKTGHPLGNTEFTDYNVWYPLHPVRVIAALLRRIYFLFVADFRWIGTAALIYAWRHSQVFRSRPWCIAGSVVLAHVLLFSVSGGAVLDRYLLPVLPIVYSAMAAAFTLLPGNLRRAAPAALAAGLIVGSFWNPPYPFPYEDNLAFTDFVRVHQQASLFLAGHYPGRRVTTAWPLSIELARPELGYVRHKMDVRELPDLSAARLKGLEWRDGDVLVLYSRQWEPSWTLLQVPVLRRFCERFYGYQPDAGSGELRPDLPLAPIARWSQRGQWIEVYARGKPASSHGI
jgi:hypothetical protein